MNRGTAGIDRKNWTRNSHPLEQRCWGTIHNLQGLELANEENQNHPSLAWQTDS